LKGSSVKIMRATSSHKFPNYSNYSRISCVAAYQPMRTQAEHISVLRYCFRALWRLEITSFDTR
jgi:hypothetical protein